MNRRNFLQRVPVALGALAAFSAGVRGTAHAGVRVPAIPDVSGAPGRREIMTVRGPIDSREMGVTLTHEHLLASFQPYVEWAKSPTPYDRNEAVQVALPHLLRIRELGCRTFVDATAVGLARDVVLLRTLAEQSGLHILTTTGNYAALDFKLLPQYVYDSTPDQLAQRWIDEWRHGIEGTDVRPGFIKLGFNGGRLTEVEQKLIRAGAIAHQATGLTIGAHTGPAVSAFEQLAHLKSSGVDPSAWIWIHAHLEKDGARHIEAARQGAWVSFDGVAPDSMEELASLCVNLRNHGLLKRTLVSQDAGWYHVGQPHGGTFRPFDLVFTAFIPLLRTKGFTQTDIDTVFVHNPANAFSIRVRKS